MVTYPKDWELKPLGDCVIDKLSYGINAPAIPYDGRHPTYIRITDITEDGKYGFNDRKAVSIQDAEKYILHHGDIVLARTGASVGKSYLYDEKDGELVYAGFLIKASIDCVNHNPRFIFGQLRSPRFWAWVATTSMRSGQPGINGKEFASFLVPVAPKKEQDSIAATLTAFDDYISDLAALIEKKKAIRDGALEDLVSGRTRLEGYHFRWTKKELREVASYGKERTTTEKRFYVSTENINQGFSGIKPYTSSKKITGIAFSSGDILMANIRPYLKKIWYADFVGGCSADVLVIHGDKISSKLLYYVLANDKFINYVMTGGVKGIKMPRGDKNYIMNYPILIPEKISEQEEIGATLISMDNEINSLEIERDKMVQVREGAMDDLLTGRVRLSV